MDIFLEILKYTLPTLIVLIVVYLIVNRFLNDENNRRNYEVRKITANLVTPIKLSAYERLVLFLERTSPESLILRVQRPGMTNLELQAALLSAIRQEYEHNFSQQLYVSSQATIMVKNAKESLVQLINKLSANTNPTDESTLLATAIIEIYYSVEEPPATIAINFLKSEVRSYFG